MSKIKFGTDGWRAIIAKEFTVDNVARVSQATAKWLQQQNLPQSIVIGHDCRFAGELFTLTAAKVFCQHGLKVKIAKGFVSTPMVSLGTVQLDAGLGVVLTASHNPPSYNGYKLKGHYGGPLTPDKVQEIEDIIPIENELNLETLDLDKYEEEGLLEYIDLETMYVNHVQANFDIEAIKNSNLNLAYDAMYGAGQNALKRILPDIDFVHCEHNPTFKGVAPEPILKNLGKFSEFIKDKGNIDCGLATDGDADRIGLLNGEGEFVDSHHIILLLIHYLAKYKGMKGKICDAHSCTPRIKKLSEHYGFEHETVKIGFKYICGIMLEEDVLVGGEESGGIAVKGHIPERDGIWMGMIVWEYMAKSGKSLNQLIEEVYELVGEFKFERNDLHISEPLKKEIVQNCAKNKYTSFGEYEVQNITTIDGYKYYFNENEWLMIRPSGTEPVLRTYAESTTLEGARKILQACKETIGA